MIVLIIISLVVFVVIAYYFLDRTYKKKVQEEIERKEEYFRLTTEARRKRNDLKKIFIADIKEQYGEASAEFSFKDSNKTEQTAFLFEETKALLITKDYKEYDLIPFSAIFDFSINRDEDAGCATTATTTTKVSTGSMVRRGLVGGILFGGVGAGIGVMTAKRESETIFNSSQAVCRYSIDLNLNSISHPVYTMNFGVREQECKRVAGLISVILQRNLTDKSDTSQPSSTVFNQKNTNYNRDTLFDDIARYVVNSKTAVSISSLQNRYSIGYNRAQKIIDQLEDAGIIGPANEDKPRAILIDAITLEDML